MIDRLHDLCDHFRIQMRRLLLLLGVSRFVSIGLAVTVALVLTDFCWHFGSVERFAALALWLGVVTFVAVRDLVQPLRQSWSNQEVLRYLDAAIPGSNDRLTNIDELRQPDQVAEAASPAGRAVVQEAVAQLERGLDQLDLSGVWQRQAVRRWLRGAAAVLLASLGLAAVGEFATAEHYTSIGLSRLLAPWADVYWPSSTRFTLLTPAEGAAVPEAEDLLVRVQLQGRIPGEVALVYHPTDESGRFTERKITVSMFVNPDHTAEYTFAKLGDSLRFHIEGGDGQTRPVEVQVVKRPYLREVQVYAKPPPYTGAAPRISNDLQLTGLEGTEVRLSFTASTPLSAAWVQLGGQAPQPLPLAEDGLRFEWFHMLKDSTSYTVGLKDLHGNREKRAETHRIQVTPDQPPTARLFEPSGDLEVTARARFRVRFQAEDDYGLKQVRFMVSRDGKPAEPLDEKITGPIWQIDKKPPPHAFDWDLDKLDLAGVSQLTFFLAAQDVNPTGRGQAESAHLQLTLRSELEVQSNVLLAAKALLTEALLGANNQRWAYLDAGKWLKTEGAAEQDQALLKQFHEEQELAQRAAVALEGRFKSLSVEMTRNRMEGAFFARRLEQIGQLIRDLATQRQPQIAKALAAARPASAAEDTPSGRVAKLKKGLTALEPSLKLAALEYQRLFYLLADWNDLQQVLVTSRRLHELQQKVHTTSVQVAPRWIGKEIEDLNEADARLLATIAQQQETIRDSERALEEELQTLALAAQSQGRKQVFTPLKENLELLRLRAVNEKLIQVAKGIKDNRIDATLQEQLYVLKVFTFVSGKFEQAGQDVTALAALDVKTPIADDREVKTAVKPMVVGDPAEGLVFNPESKVDVEDLSAYKLDTIEQALVFLQSILDDQVILYTQYTEQRFAEKERSSRYRQLRLGMLGLRVQRALEASTKVQEFAKEHRFGQARLYLQSLHADLEIVAKLVAAGQTGTATQAVERDLSAIAQTTRRFLAQHGRMATQLEDRDKSKGVDEFGQPYVAVGPILATLTQLRNDLGWALVLQQDVHQKTRRLLETRDAKLPSEPLLLALQAQALAQALERQQQVLDLVNAARLAGKERITEKELSARLGKELSLLQPDAFTKSLAGLKESKLNAGLPTLQTELLETLRNTLAALDTLADERIRPKEVLAKEVVEAQQAIGQVDLKKPPTEIAKEIAAARAKALHDFQFEVLADRIKQAPLSPEVRAYLLQSLAANPDPKYRALISAYINPLVPPPAKEKEQP